MGPGHVLDALKRQDPKETAFPRTSSAAGLAPVDSTPPSLGSFDFSLDEVGNGQPEVCGGRERLDLLRSSDIRDSDKCAPILPQIIKDGLPCDSDVSEDNLDCGSVGNSSGASIQIVPKAAADTLNFEIRVRRSAALPSNPWLSLPVDNLENSYTITITPNPTPQKRTQPLPDPPEPSTTVGQILGPRDQPAQREGSRGSQPWARSHGHLRSLQSTPEDPDLSPVCHILSSTITEERDNSQGPTEGAPTLLWDSYDLHEQNQDSVNW